MSLFNRFKKEEKKRPAPQAAKKEQDKKPALTVRQEQEKASTSRAKHATGITPHRVLLKPIVSEKSAHLNAFGQYVFKVSPTANKVMVKKAIYEAYHHEPKSVHIVRMQGKKVVRGRTIGTRSSYKKAIVMMPKGVTLPIYEGV